ncbi:MAG: DUF4956 domain-containing protein [Coriobacteriales bacterium]|jgi:uncharacterized membrane protein YhiD involved in acid resistance|nr:DUF4956 domain-containing protein [Coriobacteriales bacterium]
MQNFFDTILTGAVGTTSIDVVAFLACTAVSLVLGLVAGLIYTYKHDYNKSFVVTLAILPAVVQLVIMLVNGNLGAGLAVMGAFALVRFRSIPGSAKDIAAVFFSMAIGLATGMGFLAIAALFTLIIGLVNIIYSNVGTVALGGLRAETRQLRIMIPEDLDYPEVFDPLFAAFTASHELVRLKTTNLGSLYTLDYRVVLKADTSPKQFLDELRTRNGNLEVSLGRDIFKATTWEL